MSSHVRYMLRPDRTPMENLWACIRHCCQVYYRSVPYSVRLTDDEREDFFADLELRVFLRVRSLVLRGKYRRDLPLWNNVWGAVWSSWGHTLDDHYEQIRRKIDGRCEMLHNLGHGDVVHHDGNVSREVDTRVFKNAKYAIAVIKAKYGDYVSDTEAEGLTPVPLMDFVRNNYPEHWSDFLEEFAGTANIKGRHPHRPIKLKKKEPPKVEVPSTEDLYKGAGLSSDRRVYIWDRLNPWD